ncbi:MAG TPA: hypothetical protein VIZ43_16840 [Trebonia sp.]
MAKQGGMGFRWIVGGFDISGDISALDNIHGGPALGDFTDITQSARERKGLLRDGGMAATAFMDAANAHPVLSALPTADVEMMALVPPLVIGSPAACLNAKQIGYDPSRPADGSLTLKTEGQGSGFGLEWGLALTAGVRTDTTATNGAALDGGNGFATPAVPSSGTPVTSTSPLPATVVVSGGTVSNVVVNGVSVGTGDGSYTVPAGQAITLTYSAAPTWAWTLQTAFGAQAYLQVTAFAGTSVTVAVQDSADNSSFAAVTGLTFTAVTAAPNTQRLATANTATLRRYVRVATTGTFTSASFAVMLNRNPVAGVSF